MRHAEVAYFVDGQPVAPAAVTLTNRGLEQARAAREALDGVRFDRVITSGLPRTQETAAAVVPGAAIESWPELREIEPGRLADLPADGLEQAFVGVFRGIVRAETRFLGGETIGELLDRVIPAVDRLVGAPAWDQVLAVLHGGVNRAILSYALTGGRLFLGGFEQAPACINVLDVGEDWVVRAVNVVPYDLAHLRGRTTTMEELWREFRGAARG
jgi:probable phosphoglycerate mutase